MKNSGRIIRIFLNSASDSLHQGPSCLHWSLYFQNCEFRCDRVKNLAQICFGRARSEFWFMDPKFMVQSLYSVLLFMIRKTEYLSKG